MKTTFALLALLSTAAFAQQPAPQMPDLSQMFFQQFDADKNDQVSLTEFLQPSEAQFKQMDGNADGVLDHTEVKAFTDKMMQQMQQMRQQQGGSR